MMTLHQLYTIGCYGMEWLLRIDGFAQDSSVLAMGLLQSCNKPSILKYAEFTKLSIYGFLW